MNRYNIIILSSLVLAGAGWFAWRSSSTPDPEVVNAGSTVIQSPPPSLTAGVYGLISMEKISLDDRDRFLAILGNRFPDIDRQALLDRITNVPPNGLSRDEWHSLCNNIFEILRRQQPSTPAYTDHLLALWHDKTLDPTLRDYVLQHLRHWVYDEDSRTVHEERPEKLALIRQTFLDACTQGHPDCDPSSTTTGTALLALDDWTDQSAPAPVRIEPEKMNSLLLGYAANVSVHRGIRATALQLCARRRIPEALPLARILAADSSSELVTRLSAISFLGSVGAPADRELLTGLARDGSCDPLIHGAIAHALQSLSSNAGITTPGH